MLSRVFFIQIALIVFGLATSFTNFQVQRNLQLLLNNNNKWMTNQASSTHLYAVNKDLFSGKDICN